LHHDWILNRPKERFITYKLSQLLIVDPIAQRLDIKLNQRKFYLIWTFSITYCWSNCPTTGSQIESRKVLFHINSLNYWSLIELHHDWISHQTKESFISYKISQLLIVDQIAKRLNLKSSQRRFCFIWNLSITDRRSNRNITGCQVFPKQDFPSYLLREIVIVDRLAKHFDLQSIQRRFYII
jgi:hypothetical protein